MKTNFLECTLPELLQISPTAFRLLVEKCPNIDLSDPEYRVRISPLGIELGYPSDEWLLSPEKREAAKAAPKVGAHAAHSKFIS